MNSPPALITRRDALIGAACLCCLSTRLRTAHAAQRTFETQEIAPGIHVRKGVHENASAHNLDAIANVGFIVGTEAVAVMDPGGSLADGEQLRRHIREITQLPIRYVLMSHVHPDHIFGAGAFVQDKATFVGHAKLPAALAQRGDYYRMRLEEVLGEDAAGPIVQPTMLIDTRSKLDLGDRTVELIAHPIAHTDNDVSALDSKTRTLFASDLLFVDRVPSLDGSLKGWMNELKTLANLDSKRVVPGHGPATVEFAPAARNLERYLETLLTQTRTAIADGVEIDEAPQFVGTSEREHWALFDEYHGHNVTQAFKELEWE